METVVAQYLLEKQAAAPGALTHPTRPDHGNRRKGTATMAKNENNTPPTMCPDKPALPESILREIALAEAMSIRCETLVELLARADEVIE